MPAKTKAAATAKISTVEEQMLDILSRCTTEANTLHIEDELDRKEYLAFNKIIESVGGKWNRRQKRHVWPEGTDVHALVRDILATGEFIDPRANGFFPTPDLIADQMVARSNITSGMWCLEPSAGRGALASRMRDRGAHVVCIELLDDNYRELVRQGFSVNGRDFLEYQKIVWPMGTRFDAVVMNPPFAKGQDVAHILAAWELVKPGGVLVAIVSAGALTNASNAATLLQTIVEMYGDVEELPDGSFKDAGTSVRTAMIVLNKPEAD